MGEETTFKLPSGAALYVGVAPWEDIKALHDAVIEELRGKGLGTLDFSVLKAAYENRDPNGLNHLMDKLMGVIASKQIENAIFKCGEKALYRPDGTEASSVQVSRALFNDPKIMDKVRGDYYAIAMKIGMVNLRPFIKALFSLLKAREEMGESIQEQSAILETPSK